jgi:hypothetical protein
MSLYVAVMGVTARSSQQEERDGAGWMRQVGQGPTRDFAVILMLAAVAGGVAQVVGMVLQIGRAAGWWL